jgi:hypothetical protein
VGLLSNFYVSMCLFIVVLLLLSLCLNAHSPAVCAIPLLFTIGATESIFSGFLI